MDTGGPVHQPVLLRQVLRALAVGPDEIYVDGTFGRGGHTRAILEKLGPGGILLALDRDPEAVQVARQFGEREPNLLVEQGNFGDLRAVADQHGLTGRVNGVLLDLGVSSPQLDDGRRGFSFRRDGPLDMRMDPARGESAAEWLNRADEQEISRVLRRLGEENLSRPIARAICQERERKPLITTGQLADLVSRVKSRSSTRRHPATRTFQAVRMHINDELPELEKALQASLDVLAPAGRLCVISFHSLEDRMVKRFLRDHSRVDPALADLPTVPESAQPRMRPGAAPVRPSEAEIAANPRARSATLRTGEKIW